MTPSKIMSWWSIQPDIYPVNFQDFTFQDFENCFHKLVQIIDRAGNNENEDENDKREHQAGNVLMFLANHQPECFFNRKLLLSVAAFYKNFRTLQKLVTEVKNLAETAALRARNQTFTAKFEPYLLQTLARGEALITGAIDSKLVSEEKIQKARELQASSMQVVKDIATTYFSDVGSKCQAAIDGLKDIQDGAGNGKAWHDGLEELTIGKT